MASESSGRTFQEYLEHHLQNLVYGPLPAGHERKLYSKGNDETAKEAYCQSKNLDYDGEKYCKETLTEDGIRDQPRSRGLGDVYKRQGMSL